MYNSVVLPPESRKPQGFYSSGYVLYVNTLNKYKNIFTLVKAFSRIKHCLDKQLVVVGRETEHWREAVMPYIRKNGLEKILYVCRILQTKNCVIFMSTLRYL